VTIDLTSLDDAAAAGGEHTWYDADAVARGREADAALRPRHRYEIDPVVPRDGDAVTVWLSSGEDADAAHVTVEGVGRIPMTASAPGRWTATIPPQPPGSVVRYEIAVTRAGTDEPVADAGAAYVHPVVHEPFTRPPRTRFAFRTAPAPPPDWLRDAVIYQVLVDRFADDRGEEVDASGVTHLGFAGGTIRGLTRRLDHIASVGATVVWVSPLHGGDTHVGYDTRDLMLPDPRIGSLEDARALCDRAHALGLRLLLDIELSYLGGQHPIALAATEPHGEWGPWFHWAERPTRRFGWYGGNPSFAALDHHHPQVRDHLLRALRHWLEIGFDGFRFDSAHAAPLAFWAEVGHAIAEVQPDAAGIVEATGDAAECAGFRGRLDGYLDFERSWALVGLLTGAVAPTTFDAVATRVGALADDLLAIPFLDNHDGPRITTRLGTDRREMELALILLLTAPGPPVLYYGIEAGIAPTVHRDLERDNRVPMPWSTVDRAQLQLVTELVGLRRELEPLRRGDQRSLIVDDDRRLLVVAREHEGERVLVATNLDVRPHTVAVPAEHGLHDARTGGLLRAHDGTVTLAIGPRSARLLTVASHQTGGT
jgi:glycosidase